MRRCPSPNFNERPDNTSINLLVIHNISLPAGQFGGGYVEKLFTNCLDCSSHPGFDDLRSLEVSAHLFIDRCGEMTQFVPLNLRAWHAGESEYCGQRGCNDFSIGIELEGTDDCPYTDSQYTQLVKVTREILSHYPAITLEGIVGHRDIAPDRKTDPGKAFDWGRYKSLI